jgi:hypothetical protein
MGFGDQTGAKQSTVKTYLQDAYDRGAVLVTRCWAERIVTERGRAAGVEATCCDPQTGRSARVSVRAPQVVVACGSLESPALLLRSRIGGPATGDYLRLHPSTATIGFYADDMQAWKGAPHAGLVHEFENIEQGHGFLIEGAPYTTAVAAGVPYTDGAGHKRLMSGFRHGATFIALLRDRGHGRVTIDHSGMAVPWYSLTDELDLRIAREGISGAGTDARSGRGPTDPRRRERCAAVAVGGRPRRVHRARTANPAARWRLDAVLRAPDGHLSDGQRPEDQRRKPLGRAARRQGCMDRRRERIPHGLGHKSDDHDNGARTPQCPGGRRGRPERRRRDCGGRFAAAKRVTNSRHGPLDQ